jgi:hypothetical protein
MPKLSIRHRTTYRYRFPVQLSPIVRCYVRAKGRMAGRRTSSEVQSYAKPSAVHNVGGRDDRGVGKVINDALGCRIDALMSRCRTRKDSSSASSSTFRVVFHADAQHSSSYDL